MSINLYTAAAAKFYDGYAADMGQPIGAMLYKNSLDTLAAEVNMDSLPIGGIKAVEVTERNESSETFKPNTGRRESFVPSDHKNKYAVDNNFRDEAIAGMSDEDLGAAEFANKAMAHVNQIRYAHTAAKNKAAIDLVRSGKFTVYKNGVAVEAYDQGRSSDNELAYNFTSAGASIDKALSAAGDVLITKGAPISSIGIILGSSWLSQLGSDTNFQKKRDGSQFATLAKFQNSSQGLPEGMSLRYEYTPDGSAVTFSIFTYSPLVQYFDGAGSIIPYVPAAEAIIFPMNESGYWWNCGRDVFDSNGKVKRITGDLVIDSYTKNDPITEYIRGSSRFMCLWGNIDHTAKIVGTF